MDDAVSGREAYIENHERRMQRRLKITHLDSSEDVGAYRIGTSRRRSSLSRRSKIRRKRCCDLLRRPRTLRRCRGRPTLGLESPPEVAEEPSCLGRRLRVVTSRVTASIATPSCVGTLVSIHPSTSRFDSSLDWRGTPRVFLCQELVRSVLDVRVRLLCEEIA